MSQMLKAKAGPGHQIVFKPGDYGVKWLGFELLRLNPGESWQAELKDEEAALVLLSGRCSIAVNGNRFEGIQRADIFTALGTTVYAPRNSKLEVKAEARMELAIAKAPCTVDLKPQLLLPETVKQVSSGMSNWRRDVRLLIPPGSAVSSRLIVGETINPPGNWSGIPPHKHDTINDKENVLEEFYLFKVKPADAYGIQILNDGGKDQAFVIVNDDVAVLQQGYHPTAAAPGVTVAYLWVLSGDDKAYNITTDPRFAWVSAAESVLKEMKNN
jgi:5-deoxy-glucuronate isomerase